ncbi:MAG: hypothetical protein R1F54_06290 [Candidatus Zeuxoniibacter abyssi]|nr:MAG: hypothetical protein R1F54_06290 [Candidatus Persebacteraceae bacterium AB1(2)]
MQYQHIGYRLKGFYRMAKRRHRIIKPALLAFCERRSDAPVSVATISCIIADDKDKRRTAPGV